MTCNVVISLNSLYPGNPLTDPLTNNEDSDETQHNTAFHQSLHCLRRLKQPSGTENIII